MAKKAVVWGLAAYLAAAAGAGAAPVPGERVQAAGDRQEISYDRWLAAKTTAEKFAAEGRLVEALQHYLEYTRQAGGLGRRDLVAWGKNNAAYMIVRMHMQDATVDLAPAKKLLEEGLGIGEAREDCRRALASNLEYVKQYLRPPGDPGL